MFKKVVLVLMLQRGTITMLSILWVSKKNILIWSPVQVFSIDVYALLDLGATLSFVTPLVAKNIDVLPDILV